MEKGKSGLNQNFLLMEKVLFEVNQKPMSQLYRR